MSSDDDKPYTWVISAIASFALAAMLGVLGWWMLSGFLAGQEDIARLTSSMPRRRGRTGGWLLIFGLMGLLVSLGAVGFTGIGFAVIYKGLFGPKPKPQLDDQSWRNMPAPSDAPKPGTRRPVPPKQR
jgi:hypothetical protein